MRIVSWLVRAFIFFTLFAFALNNQHTVSVNWFFGVDWKAPMVFVVLAAFASGCALGTLAMLPGWWKHRQRPGASQPGQPAGSGGRPRTAGTAVAAGAASADSRRGAPATASVPPSEFGADHPSRLGV
jgi:lipopolysaccharide assembly protein A